MSLLKIQDLHVSIEGKRILNGINLEVNKGEIVALFGPNGSGKSTLASVIMGFGDYTIEKGNIFFKGKDITNLSPEERVKLGLTLAFQFPPKIKGIKLLELAREINTRNASFSSIKEIAKKLKLEDHLDRDFNVNFSGGEIRRVEVFLIHLQKPKFVIFDEIDSGVDVDSIRIIGAAINEMKREFLDGAIIISHLGEILEHVNTTRAYVIMNGKIVYEGKTYEILSKLKRYGFEVFKNEN